MLTDLRKICNFLLIIFEYKTTWLLYEIIFPRVSMTKTRVWIGESVY
jgi:hypothetical protein